MGTSLQAAGRRQNRRRAVQRGAIQRGAVKRLVVLAMATVSVGSAIGGATASAQTAPAPVTTPAADPGTGDPGTGEPGATPDTTGSTATTVSSGPTTTLPCVVGVPPGYVEFIGIAGRPGQTTVQFVVTEPMTGAVERGPLVVALPDHAHFIEATKSYLVRAWMSDGRLVTYLTTNDCGRPRTTLADGTAIDTALLGPLLRKTALVGLGALGTLITIALVIYLLGRVRVYGPERDRIVHDRRDRDAFRSNRHRRRTAAHR